VKGFSVILTLALGLVAAPPPAGAQQPAKGARVGVLLYGTPQADPSVTAFSQGLRDLGYVEGQNLSLEYRYAEGKPERLPDLAADLVRLQPDVILSFGGDVTPSVQKATRTIPIVMLVSNDPVQSGFVKSLARPGGNITGVTLILDELAGKTLQLLKEAAPRVSRVGVLWNPDHADPEFREIQRAARTLGVQLQSLEVRRAGEFDAAFEAARTDRAEALIAVSSRQMVLHQQRIAEFASKNRLVLVAGWGPWTQIGGLMTYGPNVNQMARRAATYVDKILRGAKPADLPVEQPTRFELVINMKTAKSLGLTIPPSILVRADQVIQ
jgi:putative ABC transport system substrate-binding protein